MEIINLLKSPGKFFDSFCEMLNHHFRDPGTVDHDYFFTPADDRKCNDKSTKTNDKNVNSDLKIT
jgi:hypothetical protein